MDVEQDNSAEYQNKNINIKLEQSDDESDGNSGTITTCMEIKEVYKLDPEKVDFDMECKTGEQFQCEPNDGNCCENKSIPKIKEKDILDVENQDFFIKTVESKIGKLDTDNVIYKCIKSEEIDMKYEALEIDELSSAEYVEVSSPSSDKVSEATPKSNIDYSPTKARSVVSIYKCTICGYITRHKTHFKMHKLTHLDPSEKTMYQCGECDYTTDWKSRLKEHSLVHKSVSEVNMYTCEECEFKTKWRAGFKRHQLLHKNSSVEDMYTCSICHLKLKMRSIERHMRFHSDPSEIQIYKCAICNFESKYKCSLKRHILSHSDSLKKTR